MQMSVYQILMSHVLVGCGPRLGDEKRCLIECICLECVNTEREFYIQTRVENVVHLFFGKVAGLQVPGHGGEFDNQAVECLGHLDLTTQTTRLCQTKGQVEHVILIIIGLLHLVKHVRVRDDNVAGRTGTRASACALHFEVIGLCWESC
jgi:hypothetical protein